MSPTRDKHIPDTRIHALIYFIQSNGHKYTPYLLIKFGSLKPLDILVMKKLGELVNVIPVLAKADQLTLEERSEFKRRVKHILIIRIITKIIQNVK